MAENGKLILASSAVSILRHTLTCLLTLPLASLSNTPSYEHIWRTEIPTCTRSPWDCHSFSYFRKIPNPAFGVLYSAITIQNFSKALLKNHYFFVFHLEALRKAPTDGTLSLRIFYSISSQRHSSLCCFNCTSKISSSQDREQLRNMPGCDLLITLWLQLSQHKRLTGNVGLKLPI